jgi:hypothetical protein
MKHRILYVLPVLALLLVISCKEDTVEVGDILILDIASSTSKVNVEPQDLPQAIQDDIDETYFETYIEVAAHVENKGYEVLLGNEDALYYREDLVRIEGRESMRRLGPCGRGFMVRPDQLPDAIKNYVANNYPDAEILRAKRFDRGWVVLISGRRLLIFDRTRDFVKETALFHFCSDIPVTDVASLPPAVSDYIDTHFPNVNIIKAFRVRNHIVVGLLTADGRKILVFDHAGNFLFARD